MGSEMCIRDSYKIHHDQNSAPFTPQGERLYTFFIYLSTPGEGGGTHFNDLGFTMEAKRGSAVLWPRCWPASSFWHATVEATHMHTHTLPDRMLNLRCLHAVNRGMHAATKLSHISFDSPLIYRSPPAAPPVCSMRM